MMITGQGNGQGGREHGQKCDQLPGAALHHRPGGARARRARVGHRARGDPRRRASPPWRSWRRSTAGEIKALLSICFNPLVSLPDAQLHARGARAGSSSSASSTSSCPRPRTTPTSCSPAACRRRTRASSCSAEGRVHPHPARRSTRRATRAPTARIICDLARAPRQGAATSPYQHAARDLRRAARGLARRASPTTTASPTRRSTREMGVFWPCPTLDHPGTPRLFEGGRFFHPDGKARFSRHRVAAERRSGRRASSRST